MTVRFLSEDGENVSLIPGLSSARFFASKSVSHSLRFVAHDQQFKATCVRVGAREVPVRVLRCARSRLSCCLLQSGHSLPPIDDEIDLHRVPPSLQKEYRVDELGNPLPGATLVAVVILNK